jgi:RNA polymerase-binding transcription factor DksA
MIYKIKPHLLYGAEQCIAKTDEELLAGIKSALELSPTRTLTIEETIDNSNKTNEELLATIKSAFEIQNSAFPCCEVCGKELDSPNGPCSDCLEDF